MTQLIQWPTEIERPKLQPILRINYEPATLTARRWLADKFAEARAIDLMRRRERLRCAAYGNCSYSELFFRTVADGTPVASTSSETTLLPANTQPVIPANAFLPSGRSFRFESKGIFSNTATPTMTWFLRMGGTVNSLAGTSIGQSAAITTASGVSNVFWRMRYDMESRTDSASGASNTTISGGGTIESAAGFASPFNYPLTQAASAATWTWTGTQADIQNYINWSLTWSANSSSNTCTLKSFKAYSEN